MPLLALPPEDLAHQRAFSALGRALHLASCFESDCRILVFALKIRDPILIDKPIDDFAKLVLVSLGNLSQTIATTVALPEKYKALLASAREARNYVAHEASEELDRSLALPEGIERWRIIMGEHIEAIAIGRVIIAILLSRYTAEARPDKDAIKSYPEITKKWALYAENNG